MLTRPDWGRIITKKYKKLLLSNGESMSAYIAYNARADMSESDYTVGSFKHKQKRNAPGRSRCIHSRTYSKNA